MDKQKFMEAYEAVHQIENLLVEAGKLFNEISPEIREAIFNYHNPQYTLSQCLRWGSKAATEIREDWHVVVSSQEV